MNTAEQYQTFRAELDRVCRECGRNPQDVLLVAVSKTVDTPAVSQAIDGGAADFGENRPDELVRKHASFPQARWHFIGNVQSRRIADIVPRAHLIHSVFKVDHLPKIDAAAARAGKVQDILLEVNAGEEQKGGVAPHDAPAFIEAAAAFSHVRVRGLMTMAPQGSPALAQASFAALRELRDKLASQAGLPQGWMSELSMGMSEDWPQAIAEGATIIRVGRAVFSANFS